MRNSVRYERLRVEGGGPPLSLFLQVAKPTMFQFTLFKQNREARHLSSSGIVRLPCSASHWNIEVVVSRWRSLTTHSERLA